MGNLHGSYISLIFQQLVHELITEPDPASSNCTQNQSTRTPVDSGQQSTNENRDPFLQRLTILVNLVEQSKGQEHNDTGEMQVSIK